jgi:hypothetical protein
MLVIETSIAFLVRAWRAVADPFSPAKVRLIETVGCMASDGPSIDGVIVKTVTYNVYDGSRTGSEVPFYVIRTATGEQTARPVQDAFRAADGVLEFRH